MSSSSSSTAANNRSGGIANRIKSLFSISFGASLLTVLYIGLAVSNLYFLMFPLSKIDLTNIPTNRLVNPLWATGGPMQMRVYLSTKRRFGADFLRAKLVSQENKIDEPSSNLPSSSSFHAELLWDQEVYSPAFSKSFLLTSLECSTKKCHEEDTSYQAAVSWLDEAERTAVEKGEGGVMATVKNAGQGIESTSILLTAWSSLLKKTSELLAILKIVPAKKENNTTENGILERTVVNLSPKSKIWSALASNSTLYVHVIVVRTDDQSDVKWPTVTEEDFREKEMEAFRKASRTDSLLTGQVDLVKYDPPHHIDKPRRILYHDVVYLVKKCLGLLSETTQQRPPWDMSYSKPEEYKIYKESRRMNSIGQGYPYWKPEASIKYVNDQDSYPLENVGHSGMPIVQVKDNAHRHSHPTGYAFLPALHVDEIGLTSEKYIPINETVTSLPLRISFDRSDMEHDTTISSTGTAGGISPARWRLLTHLSNSLESQKQMGFEQSDIDDVRRLIADTNVTLLAITLLASTLHMLFEFLTFKSEVSFWQNNKDLTGLSVRSLFLDMIGQIIILLFLIEKESSLLMTVPSGIGCLIALWKCQRAAGLRFVPVSRRNKDEKVVWWNRIFRLVGYEVRATRLELKVAEDKNSSSSSAQNKKARLHALTMESDEIATKTLGSVLLPMVVCYTLYSLILEEHTGWYSWLITSASTAVYAFGFVLMTPQLFLNWKMKSVAHLPWRVLMYKSLNTFIDDLFSFIIRMPTAARISCFRDDVVFFIYLYQRWLYEVDTSRPVEGADGVTMETGEDAETKKNQ